MSKKCLVCDKSNPDEAKYCKKCGTFISETTREKPKIKSATRETTHVVIADMKIPFASMVILMVKWVIASIPAIIILFLIGLVIFSVLGAIGTTVV